MTGRAVLLALCAASAVPALAAPSGPSATPDDAAVPAGDRYVIRGTGWSAGGDYEGRVWVSRRLGHGVRVGSAPVAADGTFAFGRVVGAAEARGSTVLLDVTQFCDRGPGVPSVTRTVRVRVIAPSRLCPGTIAVKGRAYVLRVAGGVTCESGAPPQPAAVPPHGPAHAIGPYLGARISPSGWDCALESRVLTGADAVCRGALHPSRRVTARRVREV